MFNVVGKKKKFCDTNVYPLLDFSVIFAFFCEPLDSFTSLDLKGVVYDSGESLLIFVDTQEPKQIHPSPHCSFKLARITHSITLSGVRARVGTYYTEVFSGNAAKTLVFDVLGLSLYPSRSVCFSFTEPGLCMNTGTLWIWQKVFWIRIVDYTFKQLCKLNHKRSLKRKIMFGGIATTHRLLRCDKGPNYTLLFFNKWSQAKKFVNHWFHI